MFWRQDQWGDFYTAIAARKGKDIATALLPRIEEQLTRTPNDERLYRWWGNLLVIQGRFTEAEVILQRCLVMPRCSGDTKAAALYDLACVYAQTGVLDKCRERLEESHALRPLDPDSLARDPDLGAARDQNWFQDLMVRADKNQGSSESPREAVTTEPQCYNRRGTIPPPAWYPL